MDKNFIEQIVRQQREFEIQYKPIADGIQATLKQFEEQVDAPAIVALKEYLKQIENQFSRPVAAITQGLEKHFEYASRLAKQAQSAFEAIAELPSSIRAELGVLAARGWYLDPELPASAPAKLRKAIETGDQEAADAALVLHFTSELPTIRSHLITKYPKRAHIFNRAVDAHEQGAYELSVPVLLTQVDGICWDMTSFLLFKADNKRPQVAKYVDQFSANAYRHALLTPLLKMHPISASEKARPAGFDGLNRHQVLHGESVTYNTEMNSLKVVSLLKYLSWVLHFADEDGDST
ncbi:hypothetical protein DFR29_109160 [Tahibacter aquaticus]|uniref:Uncharacterized protein n=1 Tax=Tahibacter aquaticus TaxID=520092 RepID=A0A4R6YU93_9GAMM|nr:hypothetical protein [Tahibacter aquaticus]TDR42104.1 hypothetical protein DFR29_109160 [Tahibacter aquaticus]